MILVITYDYKKVNLHLGGLKNKAHFKHINLIFSYAHIFNYYFDFHKPTHSLVFRLITTRAFQLSESEIRSAKIIDRLSPRGALDPKTVTIGKESYF